MSMVLGQALENARTQQRTMLQGIESQKIMAILEYVAMMADVDLEDAEETEGEADV